MVENCDMKQGIESLLKGGPGKAVFFGT